MKEEGHGKYIVECHSDNCMDVFESSGLPRLGEPHNGVIVTKMQATRLTKGIYLVTIQVDPAK
jgi:hypothetical protein